jgi:hypothetical protein
MFFLVKFRVIFQWFINMLVINFQIKFQVQGGPGKPDIPRIHFA